ncbi:MAG TPA: S-layer homology domain-containing protein, partial [Chloroflexia bacterium]|nr:S-layer homology domain-containing protein [Chloroflexia bacterium]
IQSMAIANNQAALDGCLQISNSWSGDETSGLYTVMENVLRSNSLTGHAYVFSSGDTGSASSFPPYTDPFPSYPASSPYVTTAGGTRFSGNIGTTWPGETAWAYASGPPPTGSGGGYSRSFNRPAWQVAPGFSNTRRGYPDVAGVADVATGVFVCFGSGSPNCSNTFGGTSLSAPLWAGMMALTNQYLAAQSKPLLGFANAKLYPLVNTAQPYPPFHDITSGTNGAYSAGPVWDAVTGLGTPDLWNLVRDLAAASVGATNTPGPAATNTPAPLPTNTPPPASTATPVPTAAPCTPGQFSDVPPGSTFYPWISDLVRLGAISGYSDCTFRPFSTITRGQAAKVMVLGFGLAINTSGGPHFSDVPSGSPFFAYVETAYNAGIISGYADGTFRPANNVTRGQLTKMVSLGRGWRIISPATPSFYDVPASDPFFGFVETTAAKAIISGYSCGGPGEPCDSTNRPYFRAYNTATRGQGAKIIDLAIYAADATVTPLPPSNTPTRLPTNTAVVPPSNTPGLPATSTPAAPTATRTVVGPSPTRTTVPNTATVTPLPTSTAAPPPVISGFNPPNVEQYDDETQITLSGSWFGTTQGAGFVVVNNVVATVDSWSDTVIRFRINNTTGPASPAPVRVVRNDGQFGTSSGFTVLPRQRPYVFSYTPSAVLQGDSTTVVTMAGTRFGNTPGSVTLVGIYPATIVSWTDTAIQFTVHADTPAFSPISVFISAPETGSYKEFAMFSVLPRATATPAP